MIDRFDPGTLQKSVRQDEAPNLGLSSIWWHRHSAADDLLPVWGGIYRDYRLREYWYATHNTLLQGAISNLIKRVTSTPWEIRGGRNLTRRYQELLQNAEFGEGWKVFITKALTDYFTQDFGAVIEVIGAGNANEPIRGPVLGLANLDRQRCVATGNFEYPIVYYNDVINAGGKKETHAHQMHHTRVIRWVDMPSPIERAYGNGLCALSRAITVSNAQILMGRYQNEKLSNEPPSGLIIFSNVNPDNVDDFERLYAADRQRDGTHAYAPVMKMTSVDPAQPVDAKFIPFSELPDHFNLRDYMETHVNMLALALGEDPQEIWPLTGQPLGTGTQSKVLHAKGRAKAFADVLTLIERTMNLWVLPSALEFATKFSDSERDKEEADTAQVWAGVVTSLKSSGSLTEMEARQLLANRVPAFADVLFDEAGNVRLPDDDVQPDQPSITANDDTTLDTQTEDGAAATANEPAVVEAKEYADTQAEFIRNLTDLIDAGMNSEVNRRRFGTVLRANLARLGRKAYEDGLVEGGVDVGEEGLSEDDLSSIAAILADQSGYVTHFADSIFSGAVVDAASRAILWANKSLEQFFMAGLSSADANGMYVFTGPDGQESCRTCQSLKGKRYRLKTWIKKKLRPKIDTDSFECGGWNCEHYLERT